MNKPRPPVADELPSADRPKRKRKTKDDKAPREKPRLAPYKREHDYIWVNTYGDDE